MRPTARPQSNLYAPLNTILGSEGAVRILRALTQSPTPMSAGVLAQHAQLERSSARRTLQSLVANGIVTAAGAQGGVPHYSLRTAHPLAAAVTALFAAEERRAKALIEHLTAATHSLKPPPVAAWIEGPAAEGTDGPADAVLYRIVDQAPSLAQTLTELRDAITTIENDLDVTIEASGLTPADVAARLAQEPTWGESLLRARSTGGLPPSVFVERARADGPTTDSPNGELSRTKGAQRRIRSHADHDAHALELAKAIVARMDHDPTLIPRAHEFVAHRLLTASPHERHELEEWATLLRSGSPQRVRHILLDPGERATRLRQTWPFVGMLNEEESSAVGKAASKLPKGRRT